ncbi:hypothetical protein [Glycomyces tritici]|uniref:Uncharacterized protein n=1 Tax=Glycomyces tritici TaxID=2665176 RepID=A0ABT7YLL1_9ACTN|nr:hypothetical protein [Glycomyces tritici]MDN3239530.1 hypothetical protein [Glycomyces tritici]
MTRSGERNALEPDLVPVLQRVRDLCGRFTEGPLPSAEVKVLRDAIEKPRPGGRELLPSRRSGDRERSEVRKQRFKAAVAELAGLVRSAASCSDADLELLGERLRELRDDGRRLRLDPESVDLGLSAEQTRTIALHLLHNGIVDTEVLMGLQLMERAAEPEDVDLISTFALIGGNYGFSALRSFKRLELPASRLFAIANRMPAEARTTFSAALGKSPGAEIGALLATLSAGEAITLLRMVDDYQGTPTWIEGNEPLAAAVCAAAENPLLMGDGSETPFSMAWLRDEIRYGAAALLGYAPCRRREAIGRLNAWLGSPRALRAVRNVVARRPRDSRELWLHRQVLDAQRDRSEDFPAGLAVRIAVPAPGSGDVCTHLLIDGVPLMPRTCGYAMPRSPECLLHKGDGLRATAEPREVKLAEPDCTEGCCGALRAEVKRDEANGHVEWEVWHTRSPQRRERFKFDAAAYDAEIARAAADFTWEWPARRAARLLRERLHAEPGLLSEWECRFGSVASWNTERSALLFHFSHPGTEPAAPTQPSLMFLYKAEIPDAAVVDDDAVRTYVDQIVERFRNNDPKRFARIVFGSKELAESLGLPWR